MTAVVIALLPAAGFGIYNFGPRALAVMAVTIASTVLTELLFGWLWKKKITITDMSAVVTGLLLALNLPVSIPLWMAALGGVFAILVVKMLFGGLGQNFMNPALAARCFLLISFPSHAPINNAIMEVSPMVPAVLPTIMFITLTLSPAFSAANGVAPV